MVDIRFTHLTIDEITRSSGVFTGRNQQVSWRAEGKHTQGFGVVEGDHNTLSHHVHTVYKSQPKKDEA
ncbi:hypothetical protein GCM10011391_29660 [Pullulanibacillus camelliae]|uniref:Uncharacterized protein n=1 Tax=Pullulanibacillus camelliae TaxID=1707096 RepID=A0A8J2YKK4_9BACL|nr:hypothetical protein [Pullulanibacillus camelliae]GGE48890.1 hypothetical protein GCM10011391_29660 [Pullulanibacillus camelliae]